MISRLRRIKSVIGKRFGVWILMTLALTLIYYLGLVIALILKFRQLPNYVNSYNWIKNVIQIMSSTPSLKDSLLIIKDEWLLEIGHMTYDYGIGISEWSLYVEPVKLIGIMTVAAIVAASYLLIHEAKQTCSITTLRSSKVTGGVGVTFVALASITMSWVVCCSSPTWVAGFSMMGLGISTSLWLEPFGIWINVIGFLLAFGSLLMMAGPSKLEIRD